MRTFLLIFGWASFVGSLLDAAVALLALWVVAAGGWIEPGLSVDTLLREQLPFVYWVKQVAFYVLPHGLVDWVFALPALALFPLRAVVSTLVGAWAISVARHMA